MPGSVLYSVGDPQKVTSRSLFLQAQLPKQSPSTVSTTGNAFPSRVLPSLCRSGEEPWDSGEFESQICGVLT